MCFSPPFDVKCKTLLGLAKSRIKFLRNKREGQLKQMKQELASFLKARQEPSAHLKVEQIHREQKIMAAYEVINLFCEQIVTQLPIIKVQKQCPIDLREAIASIIYAAPRCSDIPELKKIGGLLSAKYGKEFTTAAAELSQDNGVNRVVIEKLSISWPSMEIKMKLMIDIAAEQGLDWDPTDLKSQVLMPHEDVLTMRVKQHKYG
ncbi:hypothetical protein GOP47_0024725 [Adiantum capillus-veneris]|uniref:IST1-like protein n=1 Tax=Adiantum capillus-veneris TaxID=13818 RepID=A0A9D4U2N4_ADICA|nr:hypothetical protein GOP47_0024725 [Adiantum capillus-veneris]